MISVMDLRAKRKRYTCEWCGVRPAQERHHGLIGRDKRFPELDAEENLMLACAHCHTDVRVLDRHDIKLWFWGKQCDRYGVDHMLKWAESLPDKLRISGRLDFIREFAS